MSLNATLTGDNSFTHLPPTIQSLNVCGCSRLHSSAIDHLHSACAQGKLGELDVSSLAIDGPFIAMGRLFEELSLLEKLNYTNIEKQGEATDEEAVAMAKIGVMKKLKSLDLCSNGLVTDEVGGLRMENKVKQ